MKPVGNVDIKASISRNLLPALLAAGNYVLVASLLIYPLVLGMQPADIITISVLVVAVQTGQSVSVQLGILCSRKLDCLAILAGCLLAMIYFADHGRLGVWYYLEVSASGALYGVALGAIGYSYLMRHRRVGYQLTLLCNTVAWIISITICAMYSLDYENLMLIASGAAFAVAYALVRASARAAGSVLTSTKPAFGTFWLAIVGVVAGLLYRNDVNVVRGMALPDQFSVWHLMLSAYALVQAALGFVGLNEILARREQVAALIYRRRRILIAAAAAGMVTMCGTAILILGDPRSTTQYIATFVVISVAATATATLTLIAHCCNASAGPYIGGVLGFAVILAVGRFGLGPAVALISHLFVCVLVAGAYLVGKTIRDSTQPTSAGALVSTADYLAESRDRMQILHIVPLVSSDAAYGGPVRGTLRQATSCRSSGDESTLLSLSSGCGYAGEMLGVSLVTRPAHQIPRSGFGGLVSLSAPIWLLKNRKRFDVVHVHAGREIWVALCMWLLLLTKRRYLLQTHGMINVGTNITTKLYDRIVMRPIVKGASTVLYLTPYEKRELQSVFGRINTMHLVNGVDSPADRTSQPRGSTVRAVFCSRLHKRKNVTILVDAVHQLISEGVRIELDIFGPDEGELAGLRKMISRLALGESVRYLGPLAYDEVRPMLKNYHVFVLPSVNEPFPNALLEAMATGLACICTRSCGLAPYLEDNEAGLVVEGSAESIVVALRRLVSEPETREFLGNNALLTARSAFSMDAVAKNLVAAYRRAGSE